MGVESWFFEGQGERDVRLLLADCREPGDGLCGVERDAVMRTRLRASDSGFSPERALSQLRRIQHHLITLNATQSVAGLSTVSQQQTHILFALALKKPTLDAQLTLL